MNDVELKIENINETFELYSLLMNDKQLCKLNQKVLSKFAYQIDAYALATILNFYNSHPELSRSGELWKSNLFIIRIFSLVSAEIMNYFKESGHTLDENATINDIYMLRKKIHQFRYGDYRKKIENIDFTMGRSRNILEPHLDMFLEYFTDEAGSNLYGTSIYQYHFTEAKNQAMVNQMQEIIRSIEEESPFPPSDFRIMKSNLSPRYRWEVYCYADILKHTKLQDEKVIDRVIFAFDDLCCVSEFFRFTILNDKYLAYAPYLLFFLCKIVTIILDETFDNFKNYIDRAQNNNDRAILNSILEGIDQEYINQCKAIRNNLHYEEQKPFYIGTAEELYNTLGTALDVTELLLKRIRIALNINPSKRKLRFYRLLRWAQMPN